MHPIAVRAGMRLFAEGETSVPLRLLSSETFKTGVLNLVYAPAESPGHAGYEEPRRTCPRKSTARVSSTTLKPSSVDRS